MDTAILNQSNFFDSVPTIGDIVAREKITILPESGWRRSAPGNIEFHVGPWSQQFMNPTFYLRMSFTVRKGHNFVNLSKDDEAKVAPIPNCTSFFQDYSIQLNNTVISNNSANEWIKNYVLTTFGCTQDEKFNKQDTQFYITDINSSTSNFTTSNPEFVKRNIAILNTKDDATHKEGIVEVYCPLPIVFDSAKFFIPRMHFKILLTHLSDNLRLDVAADAKDNDYRLLITNISLEVEKLTLRESIYNGLFNYLSSGSTVNYRIERTICNSVQIPSGQTSFNTILHRGRRPRLIYLWMINSNATDAAVNGTKNALAMQSFNLKSVRLTFNADFYDFGPDIDTGFNRDIIPIYYQMLRTTGMLDRRTTNGVRQEALTQNGFILPFQLSFTPFSTDYREQETQGDLSLRLQFGKANDTNINLYFMSIFDNTVSIDRTSTVALDYTYG